VSQAITWFFEQVEVGNILEDGCASHNNFLPCCSTLLERYRHDTRAWSISGNNFRGNYNEVQFAKNNKILSFKTSSKTSHCAAFLLSFSISLTNHQPATRSTGIACP
jgi:hypothetical protein